MAETTEGQELFLLPCSICSRTFRPEALQRHEKVCEKNQTRKRKVFDSFKARVHGTDLEEFIGPNPLPGQPIRTTLRVAPKPVEKKPGPPKWKQTHEALIASLRAARGEEVPTATAALLVTSGNEQCPTCGRHFGPRAYDRHVEFCREMMSRKRTPPKNTAAQERQIARTQYRAPMATNKGRPEVSASRLSVASKPVIRKQSAAVILPSQRIPASAAARTRSRSDTSAPILTRVGSTRGSIRARGPSPAKQSPASSSVSVRRNLSTSAAPSCDREQSKLKSTDSSGDKSCATYSAITMASITALADEQMRILSSWSSDSDFSSHSKPIHPRSIESSKSGPPKSQACLPAIRTSPRPRHISPLQSPRNASPLHVSPTSAFTPVLSSKHSIDNENWETHKDNDENENSMYDTDPNIWNIHKQTSTSLLMRTSTPKPLALVRGVDASSIMDEVVYETPPPALITRSRRKTFARSQSLFEDRNRMLYLQTFAPDISSEDDEVPQHTNQLRHPHPAHSSHPHPAHTSYHHPTPSFHRPGSPVETLDLIDPAKDNALGGGDSAYSSLTRRSSKIDGGQPVPRKGSKFCHECGSKFPVTAAKFCCECGVRRLLI